MTNAAGSVGPSRRPAVVTVASWLLYLAAAGQVLSAVITLSQLGATKQAYQKLYADSDVKGVPDMLVAITAATAVGFGLIFAIGYVVLGILNGRGKNPARIVTWVLAGFAICCSGSSLISNAIGLNNLGGRSANGGPTGKQIRQALTEALPGWYQPTLTAINVVSMTALVTAVVLLALPVANGFFRKRQPEAWEPPVPQVPPPTA